MVKINVGNGVVHTSLAYLLDRSGVYERTLEIRKCWKLESLISSEGFEEWIASPHPDISFTKEAANYYQEGVDKFELESGRSEVFDRDLWDKARSFAGFNQIEFETELLMKDFGINPKYKRMILKSIVCGQVDENDLANQSDSFNYDFLLDSQKLRFVIEKNYSGKEKIEILRDREMYYRNRFDHVSQNTLAKELHTSRNSVSHSFRRFREFLSS